MDLMYEAVKGQLHRMWEGMTGCMIVCGRKLLRLLRCPGAAILSEFWVDSAAFELK
jgi:hypothetical protein